MQNKVIKVDTFLSLLRKKEEGLRKQIMALPTEKEMLKKVAKGYSTKSLATIAIKETIDIVQKKALLDGQIKILTEIIKGIEASIAPGAVPSPINKAPEADLVKQDGK